MANVYSVNSLAYFVENASFIVKFATFASFSSLERIKCNYSTRKEQYSTNT